MPVEYAFFTNPQLNYIRYHGHVTLDEITNALQQFSREPALEHGQPHFFDFSQITSYEINYPKFLKFMAKLVDIYPSSGGEQLNVFHAPSGPPAEMAEMARKPWDGSETILIRITHTREQAFDILGGVRHDLLAHIKALT